MSESMPERFADDTPEQKAALAAAWGESEATGDLDENTEAQRHLGSAAEDF